MRQKRGGGGGGTHTNTHKQTNKQTNKQTSKQTNKHTHTHTQTHPFANREKTASQQVTRKRSQITLSIREGARVTTYFGFSWTKVPLNSRRVVVVYGYPGVFVCQGNTTRLALHMPACIGLAYLLFGTLPKSWQIIAAEDPVLSEVGRSTHRSGIMSDCESLIEILGETTPLQ